MDRRPADTVVPPVARGSAPPTTEQCTTSHINTRQPIGAAGVLAPQEPE